MADEAGAARRRGDRGRRHRRPAHRGERRGVRRRRRGALRRRIEVISGEEEARLAYLRDARRARAARRARSSCSTPAAAARSSRSATATRSTSGSASTSARSRFTERFGLDGAVSERDARGGARRRSPPSSAASTRRPRRTCVVGMGGAVTNLAAVEARARGVRPGRRARARSSTAPRSSGRSSSTAPAPPTSAARSSACSPTAPRSSWPARASSAWCSTQLGRDALDGERPGPAPRPARRAIRSGASPQPPTGARIERCGRCAPAAVREVPAAQARRSRSADRSASSAARRCRGCGRRRSDRARRPARAPRTTWGFTRASRSVRAAQVQQLVDLRQLLGALRIDEVDAPAVEHDRLGAGVRERRGRAPRAPRPWRRTGRRRAAARRTPGTVSSSGCSSSSRNRRVPRSRPSSGIAGEVATWISQPSESATPITTPASTPDREHADDRRERDPEVEPLDTAQPPQLGDVDHPEHDRVDDHRAENRLRQLREQRREHDQGQQHERPGDERRQRRPGARRLVQRARGKARGDRHALERARPDVRHALRDRLLVDVDRGSGDARRTRARRPRSARSRSARARPRPRGSSRCDRRRSRDPAAPATAGRAAPHRRARPRAPRGRKRSRRARPRRPGPAPPAPTARRSAARGSRASAAAPTSSVAQWISPSEPSHDASSRHAFSPSASVPVSFGSSPITTSIAAPARNPVIDRLREEPRDPAEPQEREHEEQQPGDQRDRGDELAGLVARDPRDEHGAAGDRGQRRARPGGDLARRAEERVDDRARRRGVQAVLQRDARDPRVAEVLGHDQRGHGDTGGHVAAQPGAVVRGSHRRIGITPAMPRLAATQVSVELAASELTRRASRPGLRVSIECACLSTRARTTPEQAQTGAGHPHPQACTRARRVRATLSPEAGSMTISAPGSKEGTADDRHVADGT